MNRFLKSSLFVTGLLLSVSAMAHPGHGTISGYEVWHYVTSPMHIGTALLVIVVAFTIYRVIKNPDRSTSRK